MIELYVKISSIDNTKDSLTNLPETSDVQIIVYGASYKHLALKNSSCKYTTHA
jgi:predicted nucleotidyltransferase